MRGAKKYILNPSTLTFEAVRTTVVRKVAGWVLFFALCGSLAAFCFWLLPSLTGFKSPRTAILEAGNTAWNSKLMVESERLSAVSASIDALESRNRDVYRPMFGLDDIGPVQTDSLPGLSNWLRDSVETGILKATLMKIYFLDWSAIRLGDSFDQVWSLAVRAGDMAGCIPSIPPIYPDPEQFSFSSPFGFRTDPKWGGTSRHTGIDLATDKGNPVYATGDGVVEAVRSEAGGYGNSILIDHGFGYKTRYAHLQSFSVVEGTSVRRGDNIGFTGCSGKSTGPHLHYEVLYRGGYLNPLNFMDLSMPLEDWSAMVRKVDWKGGRFVRKRR